MKQARKIHINMHSIRANKRDGGNRPVITVKTNSKANQYGHAVEIRGPSKVVYMPEGKALSCGARVWIETESDVRILMNDEAERTEEVKADLMDAFKDL